MSDTTLMISLPSRPHLVEVVRERIRLEHCGIRAEAADALWIKCHILFHDKRNLGDTERSERAPCSLEHDLPQPIRSLVPRPWNPDTAGEAA